MRLVICNGLHQGIYKDVPTQHNNSGGYAFNPGRCKTLLGGSRMNYYAEAIQILSAKPGWEKIVYEVASKNPKAIVDAHERLNGPLIATKIKEMAEGGQSKIQCIKEYRNLTGAGLKDSKEYVERLHSFYHTTRG
jgi:ribosomal protein L7/L12